MKIKYKNMIKNLKNAFQSEVASLQSKSNNILDVFTKTIKDLQEVNKEIIDATLQRNIKIAELQSEQEKLESVLTTNKKTIDKLNSILQD